MNTRNNLNFWSLLIALMFTAPLAAHDAAPADSTGLPGDNFSLEGALELFKKAASPEDFEKLLNTESNKVNNLDLNLDGKIDYIRVVDNTKGDVHAIVLQVPVSEKESQDVAVIQIEKQGDEDAILQIVGDESVYGKQVIVEPFENGAKDNGKGPSVTVAQVVVNVWLWPSVRFVYHPNYVVWVSPWRWSYYPVYWTPWHPYSWSVYHVSVQPYYTHCHVVTTHRTVNAYGVYAPHRSSSAVVTTRTTTVVRGKNGQVVGAKTTKTTTVKGRNGNTATKKTTTRARRGGK